MQPPRHRVVVIGGGFAGLNAVKSLRRAPVDVTLVDRRNFHLFQPLLYQVATGGLSPANIAAPLRGVLSRQRNCRVLMADARGFDLDARRVLLDDSDGATGVGHLEYDTLIVAAGARHSYFGHADWEPLAPGLKTIEDATEIRRRVLSAFEEAERTEDAAQRRAWLSFVVVGAGPTGVELAGALAEIARHSLKHDFRSINPGDALVTLVEAGPAVLASYPADLSAKALRSLERLGVTVRLETRVAEVFPTRVTLSSGAGDEQLATRTVLWAAGVEASGLGRALGGAAGAEVDRAGRVRVGPDLTLAGRPEVFVLGDMALCDSEQGRPLPGVAPVAIAQGKHAARVIARRLAGGAPPGPFRYRDPGNLATIGRSAAVADIGRLHFSGFLAWVLWLFVHLMAIVSFRNRVLVLLQWAWSYLSYDRSARLITGEGEAPAPEPRPPQG